jgi:hypothetical protein
VIDFRTERIGGIVPFGLPNIRRVSICKSHLTDGTYIHEYS